MTWQWYEVQLAECRKDAFRVAANTRRDHSRQRHSTTQVPQGGCVEQRCRVSSRCDEFSVRATTRSREQLLTPAHTTSQHRRGLDEQYQPKIVVQDAIIKSRD